MGPGKLWISETVIEDKETPTLVDSGTSLKERSGSFSRFHNDSRIRER
jgi:hypothetical protein